MLTSLCQLQVKGRRHTADEKVTIFIVSKLMLNVAALIGADARPRRRDGASAYRHAGARNVYSKRHALFRDTSLVDTILPHLILISTAIFQGYYDDA